MSPEPREGHRHRSGEDLTALLLDRHPRGDVARRRELDDARACPVCADELRALEALLDDVGRLVAADAARDAARDDRLAHAVLAATTREDLGWSGDWRLVGGFVRTRLAESRLLRVAAASLLAHLVALPVLAYVVLRGPVARTPINLRVESPVEDPFRPLEAEPARGIDVPELSVEEPRVLDAPELHPDTQPRR